MGNSKKNIAIHAGSDVSPVQRTPLGRPAHQPHEHEWVVFSTALATVSLMVQCVGCGAWGTVDDPSEEEWSAAFHAPSRPYRWGEGSRVRERGYGPLYVTKASRRS
jgi:hypothetical protein